MKDGRHTHHKLPNSPIFTDFHGYLRIFPLSLPGKKGGRRQDGGERTKEGIKRNSYKSGDFIT